MLIYVRALRRVLTLVLGNENAIELFLDSFWCQLLKKIIKKRSTRLRSTLFSNQIQIQSLPLLAEDS